MGYVFFDTETTGLSPAFDQILHFAAVHVDHDLQEIDRFEVRSRLQPHVVPHPAAMLTNRISVERLFDRSLPSHAAMVIELRDRLLAWGPAIFAGYNSIGFDEEMLRNALFQTLFHPYLTSGRGCGRADAYGLVQTACALDPSCLVVPFKPDGRRDFRLSSLLASNGLDSGDAHDAMSDVYGTIALCRLVKDGSPDAWQRFVRLSNKLAVAEIVDGEEGFILTEFFGGEPHHRAVVCIGSSSDGANGRFCVDLEHSPDEWQGMSDDQIRDEIARKGTPIRRLRVNAAPTLTLLEEAGTLLPELDVERARDRARQYRAAREIGSRLIRIYTEGWGEAPQSHFPEACLYSGGFVNDQDMRACGEFHDGSWTERVAIASRFADPRVRSLATRLIYSEQRAMLPTVDRERHDRALAVRLLEPAEGPLTLKEALEATERLIAGADAGSLPLLSGYCDHFKERIARVRAFLGSAIGAAE